MKTTTQFDLYNQLSIQTSKTFTKAYSTSFSLGITLFGKDLRNPIYAIYGLVRLADEIVDTWHSLDQKIQLDQLETDCKQAVKDNFSTNPILQAFSHTINSYKIDYDLVEAFFYSMRLDLTKKVYTVAEYEKYIYGSAEVVGLMCLGVFTNGNQTDFKRLKPGARALGAAFQKVNFLRDLGEDTNGLGRMYFPDVHLSTFDDNTKDRLVAEIETDFAHALPAISQLPDSSRLGVKLAYVYYLNLLQKIRQTPASILRSKRIRISDPMKLWLLVKVVLTEKLLRGKKI